jgi:glucose-1-phosphate thymidylyltransferase
MKVIIPAAGLGTRLRPHTYHRPKPLVHVAGDTVLGHVLDNLDGLEIEEMIFIVGHLGEQIKAYVESRYRFTTRYVRQEQLRGQAHAIALAREQIDGPLLIVFVDTIFTADLTALASAPADGVIHVKEVEDPRRFGIVTVTERGQITQFVEKPAVPTSNLAVVGIYYLKDGPWLLRAIDELIARGQETRGEFYLADALQIMIDQGAELVAWPVSVWEDCGTVPAILRTNRHLLHRLPPAEPPAALGPDVVLVPPVHLSPDATVTASVIGPYVHIGAGCRIDRSVVGPYVSLAERAHVTNALIHDAIVDTGARIEEAALTASLIGANARVHGRFDRLNVGDASEIDAGGGPAVRARPAMEGAA